MPSYIAKILLYIFLAVIILLSLFAYKLKRFSKYHSYFYLLGTLSILCAFISLSFESNLFVASLDTSIYLIQMGIYVGIFLIGILIMFLIRIKTKK